MQQSSGKFLLVWAEVTAGKIFGRNIYYSGIQRVPVHSNQCPSYPPKFSTVDWRPGDRPGRFSNLLTISLIFSFCQNVAKSLIRVIRVPF